MKVLGAKREKKVSKREKKKNSKHKNMTKGKS